MIMFGCSTFVGTLNESNGKYSITQVDNEKENFAHGGGYLKIEYKDIAENTEWVETKIKNEMLSDKDAKDLRASIPKGGHIYVRIFRRIIDSANLKNFSYVVMKNEKEIIRQEGGKYSNAVDTVPSRPSGVGIDGAFWSNTEIIPLSEAFEKGDVIKLFAIDKMGGRDEFTLSFKVENKK